MAWKGRTTLVQELAVALTRIGALQFGSFTLASGKLSPYYIDLRAVPSFPGTYRVVVDAYTALIENELKRESVDAIAGVPTAGLAFSSPVALKLEKPMLYVRKDAKDHGRQKMVEGVLKPGWNVVIMDDVITTGNSILGAIQAIRAEGGLVRDSVVLVDRLEGGRANLKEVEVSLHPLTDILELAEILYSKEVIGTDEKKAIANQITKKR